MEFIRAENLFSSLLNRIKIFHSLTLSLLLQEIVKCVNELFTQTYYEVLHLSHLRLCRSFFLVYPRISFR